MMSRESGYLTKLFDEAVAAASPSQCLLPFLPEPPTGHTVVVGAGKAAASMAQSAERCWTAGLSGLVVTRYGHGAQCRHIEVLEAAHPVPDATGARAAQRLIDLVSPLGADDLVIALMSGGGSALLTLPAPGISLREKQDINRALLKSGASISEMNCLRKHLSAIKGGRLAGYCAPARVACLMISDVPGDDPSTIASGPTAPDITTRREASMVLQRYGIDVGAAVRAHLESERSETPKPGDPIFARVTNTIIASASGSLEQAARYALRHGVESINLGDDLEGEARVLGQSHARQAMALSRARSKPLLILSGGETTVTVKRNGRGGRNVEYLLGLAIELNAMPGVYALAADTDGIDGTQDNAGAVISPSTLARARAAGLDPSGYLKNNDAYSFFENLGDLLITGPTLTNVNDFRAILINAMPVPD